MSAAGTICFYVYGTAHLLADVSGYLITNPIAFFVQSDDCGQPATDRGADHLSTRTSIRGASAQLASTDPVQTDGSEIDVVPTTTYELNPLVGDMGWPCPQSPHRGHLSPFWFGHVPATLGADFPGAQHGVIRKPLPSEC